jgi:hypothetical protein
VLLEHVDRQNAESGVATPRARKKPLSTDSSGGRTQSLFPPALTVNILGHVDIRVTHVVPLNLRPYAFAQLGWNA